MSKRLWCRRCQQFEMHDREPLRALERRIRELEDGSCRFNCRTGKANWIAGFKYAMKAAGLVTDSTAANEAYQHWQQMEEE